jgi:hypothetical protein
MDLNSRGRAKGAQTSSMALSAADDDDEAEDAFLLLFLLTTTSSSLNSWAAAIKMNYVKLKKFKIRLS